MTKKLVPIALSLSCERSSMMVSKSTFNGASSVRTLWKGVLFS